jgi:hypothetical protein
VQVSCPTSKSSSSGNVMGVVFLLLWLMVGSQLPSSQSRGRMHYPSYYRITTSIAANPLMFYPQIFLKSLKSRQSGT